MEMEMTNHFSHEEHPLVFQEFHADDDNPTLVICGGCEQPVCAEPLTYSCNECGVFLHKSCAQLPTEITHPTHQHALKLLSKAPYKSGRFFCDMCGGSSWGFTYHCSECEFDLDVLCAQMIVDDVLIDHRIHKHPLFPKEILFQGDDSAGIVCYGCGEPVSGSSVYCCRRCKVFVHKSCVQLSPEIKHSTHSHSLKLLSKAPYESGSFFCDICGRSSSGFTYHCSECGFDLDVLCAQLYVEGIYKRHIHAGHALVLKELVQQQEEGEFSDDEKVANNCCACGEPVSGSSTYFCVCCKISFHKSCVEDLPPEIEHPMHFEHPLKLFSKPPYEGGSCVCKICKRSSWNGLTYHCSECEFDVDVLCARFDNIITKHPSHHHPLRVQKRSALFECDACGLKKEDESYDCTECSFWIHKACASLPTTSLFKDHPHGHLSLAYRFPEKYKSYGFKCDVCREKFQPIEWLYYCGPCRYFVHLHCMSTEDDPDEVPPDVVRLPVEGVSSTLIQHFFSEHNNNGLQQIDKWKEEIDHFSHHHPLILWQVEDDYSEMYEDDQETVCDGCAEPILGSCYSCAQCKYYVHLHCAQLPTEIPSHPDHPQRNLSLSRCKEFFRFSYCKICGRESNGFFYECKVCNDFVVDIKCALLPTTVKHEAHKHLLIRDESSSKFCNACTREHGAVILGCKRCEFYLAIQCIMLPQIVRHRWDDHPLFLTPPPFYFHEDEFICDMCEKEIHPKYWLYHCRQCDNSFHPRCIPRLRKVPYVKFGGTLEIDYHPQHPLTFLRNSRFMSPCDRCGRDLSGMTVFECESCMLSLCRVCVCEIVDPNVEVSPQRDRSMNECKTM